MKMVRFQVPGKSSVGKRFADAIRDSNQPCQVPNRLAGSDSWVVVKSDGKPLAIQRADFDEYSWELGISWGALPLWVLQGRIGEHNSERLVIEPVEVDDEH